MSAEQTPDIERVLAEHLWSDRRDQECGCGWQADGAWMVDRDQPNRVEQWLAHVAQALAPVLAAAVRDAKVEVLREVALEGVGVAYMGAGMPFDAVSLAFIEQRAEEIARADRVAEPQHEAATSSSESEG